MDPHTRPRKSRDDQHERTFSSYVRIQVVVLKTCLGRWTIGRSGEERVRDIRAASTIWWRWWYIYIYIYIYIFVCVCVCVHTHVCIYIHSYKYFLEYTYIWKNVVLIFVLFMFFASVYVYTLVVSVHVCIHVIFEGIGWVYYVWGCIWSHMSIYFYASLYIYIYIYMCVCVCG